MTVITGSYLERKMQSESSRTISETNGSKTNRVGGGYQRKQTYKPSKKIN